MTHSGHNSENPPAKNHTSQAYSGLPPESSELTPRNTPESVRAGLHFLFSSQRDHHWKDFGPAVEPETWVTAYVLAQVGELPPAYIDSGLRRLMYESLDWLLEARSPAGGWGYNRGSEDDADSTAWGVLALRRNGRQVPS